MGWSTVRYGNKSFEAADVAMEVWLRLLVIEAEALAEAPQWLAATRDDWNILATEEFGFGVIPDLDGLLTSKERRDLVLSLAERALARLESFGDPVPAARLNALRSGRPDSRFTSDVPAEVFLSVARSFIDLITAGA